MDTPVDKFNMNIFCKLCLALLTVQAVSCSRRVNKRRRIVAALAIEAAPPTTVSATENVEQVPNSQVEAVLPPEASVPQCPAFEDLLDDDTLVFELKRDQFVEDTVEETTEGTSMNVSAGTFVINSTSSVLPVEEPESGMHSPPREHQIRTGVNLLQENIRFFTGSQLPPAYSAFSGQTEFSPFHMSSHGSPGGTVTSNASSTYSNYSGRKRIAHAPRYDDPIGIDSDDESYVVPDYSEVEESDANRSEFGSLAGSEHNSQYDLDDDDDDDDDILDV